MTEACSGRGRLLDLELSGHSGGFDAHNDDRIGKSALRASSQAFGQGENQLDQVAKTNKHLVIFT